jgi:hypothetical protein
MARPTQKIVCDRIHARLNFEAFWIGDGPGRDSDADEVARSGPLFGPARVPACLGTHLPTDPACQQTRLPSGAIIF